MLLPNMWVGDVTMVFSVTTDTFHVAIYTTHHETQDSVISPKGAPFVSITEPHVLTFFQHEITEDHIRRVLKSTRPSVSPEERDRLDLMCAHYYLIRSTG
jgi:hypothetical protein